MLRGKTYQPVTDPIRLARCVPNVLIVTALDPGLEQFDGVKLHTEQGRTAWYFDAATTDTMDAVAAYLEQNGIKFFYRRLTELAPVKEGT